MCEYSTGRLHTVALMRNFSNWDLCICCGIVPLPTVSSRSITYSLQSFHYLQSPVVTLPTISSRYITYNLQSLHYLQSPVVTLPTISSRYITYNLQSLHYLQSPVVTLPTISSRYITYNLRYARVTVYTYLLGNCFPAHMALW